MTTLESDSLPASLAGLLTEEQRQTVLESPREKRLEALAAALARPESEVLTKLAAAANLDVASNLETDPDARGLLPARLVHEYQIIPIRFTGSGRREQGAGELGSSPSLLSADSSATDSVSPFPQANAPLHLASAWLPDATMTDWLRTFTPRPLIWHLA